MHNPFRGDCFVGNLILALRVPILALSMEGDVQRHSSGGIIPQANQKLSTDSISSRLVLFPLQGGMQAAASGF